MIETELTDADKKRIKTEIRLTFIIIILFTLALILLVGIGFGIANLFGVHPTEAYDKRVLLGAGLLFLPLMLISWKNILKFLDIKKSKKVIITLTDYKIKSEKNGSLLVTSGKPKFRFDIYKSLVPLLRPPELITIEVSKLSKTLLFISHNDENLIDKVEAEEARVTNAQEKEQ